MYPSGDTVIRFAQRARRFLIDVPFVPFERWLLRRSQRPEPVRADCIVVPGALVFPDGSASELLCLRVAHAVALYRRGLGGHIVLTGGPRSDSPTEAQVALRLAVEAGVPVLNLQLETRSRNTLENLLNARDLMAEHGWVSCLLSTDPFHMRRCLAIARDIGLRAYAAPAPADSDRIDRALQRYMVSHECRALLRYALNRAFGRTRQMAKPPTVESPSAES